MASVENGGTPPAPPRAKKTAVEEIYQKKSQLEHILLRPDTYIGKKFNFDFIVDKMFQLHM
jgi:DNA topoisomerase-2